MNFFISQTKSQSTFRAVIFLICGLLFTAKLAAQESYSDVLTTVLLDADDTIWRDHVPGIDNPVSANFKPNRSLGYYTTDYVKLSSGERVRKTHVLEADAVKFIVHLLVNQTQVYLYTNSQLERNTSLLKQIPVGEILPSEKAALIKMGITKFEFLSDLIPEGRILDSKAMVQVSEDSKIPFFVAGESRNALKKNAKKWINPNNFQINKTIIIDDSHKYQALHQENNLLWLGDRELDQKGSEGFYQSRRLAFASGLIDRAVKESRETKTPITQVLWELQWGTVNMASTDLKLKLPLFAYNHSLIRAAGFSRFSMGSVLKEMNCPRVLAGN